MYVRVYLCVGMWMCSWRLALQAVGSREMWVLGSKLFQEHHVLLLPYHSFYKCVNWARKMIQLLKVGSQPKIQ